MYGMHDWHRLYIMLLKHYVICIIVYHLGTDSQQLTVEVEQPPQEQPPQEQPPSEEPDPTRRIEWSHKMTLLLLELYRTSRTQFRSAKHVKNVWQKIAADMNSKGYKVTWQMCEKKFRNMKGTFKDIKDHNRKSGRGRKQWPYLELFNELMGNEPAISPSVVEVGSKAAVEPKGDTEPSMEVEPQPSTSATSEESAASGETKPATIEGGSRKRKRAADKMPTWFSDFREETKQYEEAKFDLLKKMHDDQKTAAAERLEVMKDLNQKIKSLIEKL